MRASISAGAGASDTLSLIPIDRLLLRDFPVGKRNVYRGSDSDRRVERPGKWLDGLGHLDRDRGLYLHQVRLLDRPVVARTADSDRNADVDGPILDGITLILRADICITGCISENRVENARYIYRRKLYCIRVQTHAGKQ